MCIIFIPILPSYVPTYHSDTFILYYTSGWWSGGRWEEMVPTVDRFIYVWNDKPKRNEAEAAVNKKNQPAKNPFSVRNFNFIFYFVMLCYVWGGFRKHIVWYVACSQPKRCARMCLCVRGPLKFVRYTRVQHYTLYAGIVQTWKARRKRWYTHPHNTHIVSHFYPFRVGTYLSSEKH